MVTGLLVAVYPPLLANDTFLLTEPLSLLLLLGMLHVLDRGRWAWAGVLCGLLILSRPSAQFIVVVVAIWVLWRLGWKRALYFAGVTALVVVPWVVRNWVQVGEPVLVSSNGFNFAASYSPQAKESNTFVDPVFDERFASYRLLMFNEAAWDKEMQKLAFDLLKDDPSQVFSVVGRNMTFRDRTLWTFYIVTLLGLFGLVVRSRDPMVLLLPVVVSDLLDRCATNRRVGALFGVRIGLLALDSIAVEWPIDRRSSGEGARLSGQECLLGGGRTVVQVR